MGGGSGEGDEIVAVRFMNRLLPWKGCFWKNGISLLHANIPLNPPSKGDIPLNPPSKGDFLIVIRFYNWTSQQAPPFAGRLGGMFFIIGRFGISFVPENIPL